jgi:hypothetical protein
MSKRKPNWTDREKFVLLEEYEKRKAVLKERKAVLKERKAVLKDMIVIFKHTRL